MDRSHFSKLLVSIRPTGAAVDTPILIMDVDRRQAEDVIDKDVGGRNYIDLDGDAGNGLGNFNLTIQAIPVTYGDVAVKIAEYSRAAIGSLPTGVGIESAMAANGAGALVNSLLQSLEETAQKYRGKVWSFTKGISLESALKKTQGRSTLLLCPDEDQESPGQEKSQSSGSCQVLPEFYSCASDGTLNGVQSHICKKDGKKLVLYTDKAWIGLRFELLKTPGNSILPTINCSELTDKATVDAWEIERSKCVLSQRDQRALEWFASLLKAYVLISRSVGAEQVQAFLDWKAAVDAKPTPKDDLM